MIQEGENKLNTQDKDPNYAANKHSYQNIDNKYIDTDPLSYITDLIIQVSKNITKGHGLSKRGVNSLFLFLLTGGLLYQYAQSPQNITEFFTVYAVPLVFLFYSFMDILKNVSFVNTLYVRIFKQSDFVCDTIINYSISLDELERYLLHTVFTSQQFTDIMEYLVRNNQLSPQCQVNLMRNYSLYEVESINYVKDLLLKFNFTPQAVCIFLSKMQKRLDCDYLDKLTEKYRDFPTILFLAGAFHLYKADEPNSLYKYGYECEHNPPKFSYSRNELLLGGIVIILLTVLAYIIYSFSLTGDTFNANMSANLSGDLIGPLSANINIGQQTVLIILAIIALSYFLSILNSLYNMHSIQSVQKYLTDKNLDEVVIEHIIEDLNYIDYFHRPE
ncbi:MAG: hypothetical protein ACPK85_10680 [Methanosarcina sp.]